MNMPAADAVCCRAVGSCATFTCLACQIYVAYLACNGSRIFCDRIDMTAPSADVTPGSGARRPRAGAPSGSLRSIISFEARTEGSSVLSALRCLSVSKVRLVHWKWSRCARPVCSGQYENITSICQNQTQKGAAPRGSRRRGAHGPPHGAFSRTVFRHFRQAPLAARRCALKMRNRPGLRRARSPETNACPASSTAR
jgi:hypothetical protein